MISNSSGKKAKQRLVAEYTNSPKSDSGQMYRSKDGQKVTKGNLEKVFEFRILKDSTH